MNDYKQREAKMSYMQIQNLYQKVNKRIRNKTCKIAEHMSKSLLATFSMANKSQNFGLNCVKGIIRKMVFAKQDEENLNSSDICYIF